MIAVAWSRPRAVSFTSIESKCGLMATPVPTVPPSNRMPAPDADEYAVITPVSGRNEFSGSSVVIRHWMAAPRGLMSSWRSPISASDSPAAMRS